jgi:hypothetical protein
MRQNVGLGGALVRAGRSFQRDIGGWRYADPPDTVTADPAPASQSRLSSQGAIESDQSRFGEEFFRGLLERDRFKRGQPEA